MRSIKKKINQLYKLQNKKDKLEQELCETLNEMADIESSIIVEYEGCFNCGDYIVIVDKNVKVYTQDEYEKL